MTSLGIMQGELTKTNISRTNILNFESFYSKYTILKFISFYPQMITLKSPDKFNILGSLG